MINPIEDIHNAEAYQEAAEHLDAVAAVSCGLAQARQGQSRSVDEVFDDLEHEPAPLA